MRYHRAALLPQPDLVGQTIGNYLVTQKLGEGGMGAVYLAEHPGIGKKVALKVLHSEFSSNQEVAARFFNEAKAVNDIQHPNIVDIIDFGIIQGATQLVYFIMEYLAGETLSQLIRREAPLPPERAIGIGLQVADALSASHRCGIVHRDLKPDNIILLQRTRERDFVKLLDFGIAKLTSDNESRTRTGIVMGTPAYMSPEQCDGRGLTDHRTDIYALGIVLYEMLVGRVPFVGEAYGDVLVQHLTQSPRPPSQYRMLQPHIEAVVMKALEKRPEMRYPNMDEMIRALTDPVGYVESFGGIPRFMQAQLMPSTAPLPMKQMPSQIITAPPPMGSIAPPVPTGFGVQPRRGIAAFVIAGTIIVAGAVVGVIIVLASGGKQDAPPPGDAKVALAATVAIDAAVPDAPAPPPPPVDAAAAAAPATVKLSIKGPKGATVLIDGKERGKAPVELVLDRDAKVKLEIKLAGYAPKAYPELDLSHDQQIDPALDKLKYVPPMQQGSSHGSNDTGLMKPGD